VYRDALDAAVSSLRLRQAALAERNGKLDGLRRAILPDAERAELAVRKEKLVATARSLDEATALGFDLDVFEEALSHSENLADALLEIPVGAPSFVAEPGLPIGPLGRLVVHATEAYGGEVAPWQGGIGARLQDGELALLLRASADLDEDGSMREVLIKLWASAPPAIEAISIRPESVQDVAKKVLGITSEVRTGDDPFDDAYFVSGREDLVRAVLVPRVTRHLTRLSWIAPSLDIDGGLAKLSWTLAGSTIVTVLEHAADRSVTPDVVLPAAALDVQRELQAHFRDARASAR
jgi:hypothetical protein